ncbi:ribosome rescue protein RqcH [Methanohalophilus profundi]|uniref:ribosome rescue protein RqcH n=1 Tax=Methanohalophilus profundi TaxID=2138083 RepID=UPI00101BA46E|nr:ribosome rescue protein RqcH [Methanohalophilus profundi]
MKEEMTSADVAALATELGTGENSLVDSKIGKIYQPGESLLRIHLYIFKKGKANLLIEAGSRLHLSEYIPPSPKNPQSFPMLLRKHIMGGRITYFRQYDFDRIIEIGINRGDNETVLVIEIFGQGNIILLDCDRKIILPMNPVTYKGRRIRSGEIYQYPEAQLTPLDVNEDQLCEVFSHSDSDVVRTLATRFNLGGILSEEVCLRSGIDKTLPASEVNPQVASKLIEAIGVLFSPLEKGQLNPCTVSKPDSKETFDVVPFDLEKYSDFEKNYYDSFNKALDDFFGKRAAKSLEQKKEATVKEKTEDVFQRRLKQQEGAIKKFEKDIEKNTSIAEKIYEHYQDIEQLLQTLLDAREKDYSWKEIQSIISDAKDELPAAKKIVNIDGSQGLVLLDLDGKKVNIDVRLTVPQNAMRYYEKAKKLEKKRKGALAAIEDTKKAMQKKKAAPKKHFKVVHKKHWYERFRWFFSSDGFLVVGGRDATTNEELVKKYMEKRDLVFHTQAPGAPITVVKTEGKDIPETTLQEAAEFVVSFSSIWKGGQFSGDCYWIYPEQVTKTPESGEYLKKGSFIIRGERNYYRDVPVRAAVGLELKPETRAIGGPVSAVKARGEHVVELTPGKFNQNDIAKKIYRIYVEKLKDVHFVKQIASPDKIANVLPPGESDIKK